MHQKEWSILISKNFIFFIKCCIFLTVMLLYKFVHAIQWHMVQNITNWLIDHSYECYQDHHKLFLQFWQNLIYFSQLDNITLETNQHILQQRMYKIKIAQARVKKNNSEYQQESTAVLWWLCHIKLNIHKSLGSVIFLKNFYRFFLKINTFIIMYALTWNRWDSSLVALYPPALGCYMV